MVNIFNVIERFGHYFATPSAAPIDWVEMCKLH